jgi:hypothetical protein
VTGTPAAAQHLRDLAALRRVRDRIDREYAQPLDVEALARGAHMSAGASNRRRPADDYVVTPGLLCAADGARVGRLRRAV